MMAGGPHRGIGRRGTIADHSCGGQGAVHRGPRPAVGAGPMVVAVSMQ